MQEEKKGNSRQEPAGSVIAGTLGFVKRTRKWLAEVLAVRKRQQSGDCAQKAKSAQDVRDQLQNRCPWWGP